MSPDKTKPKGIHEAFATFFENPTRPALRKLLKEQLGEFDHIDFKEEWLSGPKLARHILGFANSEGGVMVVGLKQGHDGALSPDGLTAFTDKTDIVNSAKRFLPDDLEYEILDFPFQDTEYPAIKGKKFQVLIVHDKPENLPFVCLADGEQIHEGRVYVRDGVATVEAKHAQLQRILNRRIATGHSTSRRITLREHLDELKALYGEIRETIPPAWRVELAIGLFTPNPCYPTEGYEPFIARLLEAKKKVLEEYLTRINRSD